MVATPTLQLERELLDSGIPVVIGVDEVGRGALAGPVVVGACAVSLSSGDFPEGLRDSKLLSPTRRGKLYPQVHEWAAVCLGSAMPDEIDQFGISYALGLAGKRALAKLFERGIDVGASHVILDGKYDWLTPLLASPLPITARIKADESCGSVAAASVIAKVDRDAHMVQLATDFPQYHWDSNKGYGSASHIDAIREHGATEHHRRSWLSL